MRYVIVSVVKEKAGNFNNNLRREVFEELGAKSSKLPAHFTIKSPFETDDISEVDVILNNFSKTHSAKSYQVKGYDSFDNRVIFMKVLMSKDGQILHDELIDELSKVSYIKFDKHDGKDKIFHITISSKKIQKIFNELWSYVNKIPCDFNCQFDNICVYKWVDNTWKLYKEYNLV